MSDSANDFGPPRPGEMWETRNGIEWATPEPDPTGEAPTGDARRAGHHEDDVRSSYFHVRWLGEAE